MKHKELEKQIRKEFVNLVDFASKEFRLPDSQKELLLTWTIFLEQKITQAIENYREEVRVEKRGAYKGNTRGFGDPLNRLIYNSDEIKEMKNKGKIFDYEDSQSDYKKGYDKGFSVGKMKLKTNLLTIMDERLKKAAKLWCEWNRDELESNDFVYKFGKLFKEECLEEWNKSRKSN